MTNIHHWIEYDRSGEITRPPRSEYDMSREDLQREIDNFLKKGGKVKKLKVDDSTPIKNIGVWNETKSNKIFKGD